MISDDQIDVVNSYLKKIIDLTDPMILIKTHLSNLDVDSFTFSDRKAFLTLDLDKSTNTSSSPILKDSEKIKIYINPLKTKITLYTNKAAECSYKDYIDLIEVENKLSLNKIKSARIEFNDVRKLLKKINELEFKDFLKNDLLNCLNIISIEELENSKKIYENQLGNIVDILYNEPHYFNNHESALNTFNLKFRDLNNNINPDLIKLFDTYINYNTSLKKNKKASYELRISINLIREIYV